MSKGFKRFRRSSISPGLRMISFIILMKVERGGMMPAVFAFVIGFLSR